MDFTLNFCEYNRSNSDYDRIFRPEGSGDFLFLLFKTPMKVYLGGQLTVTRDNACIFYIPGNPQHYQAVRKFRNSYVHFSCGENLAKRFGLPCNEIFYPSDCQEIDHCIQKLQHEYLNREVFSRDYEYALLCQLMITASRELRSTDTGKSSDSELCSKKSVWKCLQITKSHGQQKSSAPWLISKKVSFIPVTGIFLTAPLMLT